jgi:hypothetical protein
MIGLPSIGIMALISIPNTPDIGDLFLSIKRGHRVCLKGLLSYGINLQVKKSFSCHCEGIKENIFC